MSTETEEKVEIDVDLEKDVPCETKDCDGTAAWLGRRPCCGASSLCCEECHANVLQHEIMAAALDDAGLIRSKCIACGTAPFRPNAWIPL